MPAARPVLGPVIRAPKTCTFQGCTAPHAARGLCARHYAAARYVPIKEAPAACPLARLSAAELNRLYAWERIDCPQCGEMHKPLA